jgi:hypothetical protein
MDTKKGPLPIEKMDDSKPHAELVAMLVIGLRVANYIKLVSQGYVPFSRLTGICNFR